jgi:hypothetical protein
VSDLSDLSNLYTQGTKIVVTDVGHIGVSSEEDLANG